MSYRSIVLTGASGGLGQALAPALAGPGVHMLLLGRDETRLRKAGDAAEAKGAQVEYALVSVQDHKALDAALLTFDRKHSIDLLIANAGVKAGNVLGVETPGTAARIVDVNLTGTISTVESLLPAMTARGGGQIAIVSSLAALSSQADLLSYSATKAGLRSYGIGLRRALKGSGVGVSIITPGFIDTAMTDRQDGPTPFLISPQKAAEKIVSGLKNKRNLIAFPWALVLLTRLGNLLPAPLADWANAGFRAKIEPDEEEKNRDRH